MLDPNILLAASTSSPQGFGLKSKGLEQPSCGRSECDDSALRPTAPCEPREDRHCGIVATGHLDGQCTLDLILRGGKWLARRSLQLRKSRRTVAVPPPVAAITMH